VSGYCILVVDDDADELDLIVSCLSLSGFDVIRASDGEEGLRMVDERNPDLVLLDVHMPVMDGMTCLEKIKERPRHRNTPVFMVTALDRTHLKVKGLELGAEDYITKPFRQAELIARVRGGLRRSERYRRLEGSLEGDLAELRVDEILQTLQIGKKRAVVRLLDIDAEIVVTDGNIVRARIGSFGGRDALSRILLRARGRFRIDFPAELTSGSDSSGALIATAVESLMDATVTIDELLRLVPVLRSRDPVVDQEPGTELESGIARLAGLFPMPLTQLLVLMDLELLENAAMVGRAIERKALRLNPEERTQATGAPGDPGPG